MASTKDYLLAGVTRLLKSMAVVNLQLILDSMDAHLGRGVLRRGF